MGGLDGKLRLLESVWCRLMVMRINGRDSCKSYFLKGEIVFEWIIGYEEWSRRWGFRWFLF